MSVVAFAAPVNAAEIIDVITDVDVTPTNPKIGESVRTDIDWCIPNGTKAGDTFTLTLSEYLRGLPTGFELRDGAGGPIVATASISTTTPALITFTMTAYAESHINVCGSAFIRSGFSNSLPAGVTVPFESTDGGGQSWETPVTPQPGGNTPSLDAGIKFGGFPSPDNGHTDPNDAIGWTILTPQGPLNSVVITDTVADGQNIDCATVTVLMGPREPVNIGSPIVPAPIITPLACTTESLSVTVGPLADGQAVRVRFMIDLDAPTGPGSHGFTNTATIVSTHPNGDVQTDTPRANIGSNDGGGDGGGEETTPVIDIIKFATADGPVDGTFDEAPGKLVPAGTPVPVTMTITNTGDEPLKDVTVSDTTNTGPAMTGLTCDFSPLGGPATGTTWAGPLAVDASFDCTGTVPALPAGVPHTDTADVVGTGTISLIGVDDDDPFNVTPPPPTPVIDIIKFATEDGPVDGTFDEAPGKLVPAGTPVPVTMTITNTGDEPLKDVTVADTTNTGPAMTGLTCDFSPLGGPATGTTWAGPLAVDASFDCTGTVPAMAAGETHANTADVVGTGTISLIGVDDDDPFNVTPPPPTPGIEIVKGDSDGNAADTADTRVTLPSDGTASLVFTIKNTGDEALRNVVVSDTVVSNGTVTGLSCVFPDGSAGTTYFGHVRPVPVTPTASTPPSDLAHTGSGAAPVAVVGALLLLLGAGFVGRRRLLALTADKA
jgi:LPXTG-motif cell wall-anchored protein